MAKRLYKSKWIDLYESDRGFIFAQRRSVNSTATLLYAKDGSDYKFLLRYQPLPELKIKKMVNLKWTTLYPCCVTGSLETNETPEQNVIKEVYEEANYLIKKKDIKAFNIAVSTTQMNEAVFNFIVDITNAKQIKKQQGDGSLFENISQNRWATHKVLKQILLDSKNIYLSSLASAYLLFQKQILNKV
ncbi:MAG: DNA mismatch repair protein MutT [Mycoplasmataceae bacterium]|nr:DNA mismatch repair protein MutT [Mycoplasmataceae bacterium]